MIGSDDREQDLSMKTYLGDGAYVRLGGSFVSEVILTTENGVEETNMVVLDERSIRRLADWIRRRTNIRL